MASRQREVTVTGRRIETVGNGRTPLVRQRREVLNDVGASLRTFKDV